MRRFKASQRLVDQTRLIIKNRWFSDLEILEMHQQIKGITYQQDTNTRLETLNTKKEKHSNEIKTQNKSNQAKEQIQTYGEKANVHTIKENNHRKENNITIISLY